MAWIYAIVNTRNQHFYLGSTTRGRRRWYEHVTHLRGQRHENKYLQRAFNKYGERSFRYRQILSVPKRHLQDTEQLLIDKMRPQYNVNPRADRPPSQKGARRSKETRALIKRKRAAQVYTKDHCANISKGLRRAVRRGNPPGVKKGNIPWNKGKKLK